MNTTTKQIPILFSTAMVQAILAGRKTVTRRLVSRLSSKTTGDWWDLYFKNITRDGNGTTDQYLKIPQKSDDTRHRVFCRIAAGDLLYVRETWTKYGNSYVFKSLQDEHTECRWKPSIHMPKEAARIWLKVTGVEVQRLREISEVDALAEGVARYHCEVAGRDRYKDYTADASGYGEPNVDYPSFGVATASFATLWESINGRESWEANPWVWVVRFEVLSVNGKPEGI
jgi:hypothetical protein